MNILFITAHPFLPQMFGGLQVSKNALATALKQRGHKVSVLCSLMGTGRLALRARILMKLFGHKAVKDDVLGYPVWRAWFPWEAVGFVAGRVEPDVIVILARQPVRMALEAEKTGIPIVFVFQDVEFKDHGGDFRQLKPATYVSNSQFTAEKYRAAFGTVSEVLHPLINRNDYVTDTTGENVTFINPHPLKGLDLALEIAAQCPDIPFAFVQAWPLNDQEQAALREKVARVPNVQLLPSGNDMKTIYGKAKILIAPSQWEEAYGRVASEAQFSGIPVVASNCGGLPEAVGEGGVLLDPKGPAQPWIDAVKRLWSDDAYHAELSRKARNHSLRPALDSVNLVDRWVSVLERAAESRRAR